jgi:hypothetical protein
VTDFWILSSVNAHFVAVGTAALPEELTIIPAGGALKISYLAALLASEAVLVLILLNDDRVNRDTESNVVKSKLIRSCLSQKVLPIPRRPRWISKT